MFANRTSVLRFISIVLADLTTSSYLVYSLIFSDVLCLFYMGKVTNYSFRQYTFFFKNKLSFSIRRRENRAGGEKN